MLSSASILHRLATATATTAVTAATAANTTKLRLSSSKPKLPTLRRRYSAAITNAKTSINPIPSLKSRLSSGDTLYGLFLLTSSPTLAEIAGLSGYDFVVVDLEHGPGEISNALPCLHALSSTSTPAIIRLPDPSPVWAKKALDLGPSGIMFPSIESPSAARDAVAACRFPPRGIRGSAHTVVRASSYGIDDGYLQNYEDDLLLMIQVETADGVAAIEEIAAVDGVDCIQMGPLDLSASLGYLWEPGHRKVREVLWEVERKVIDLEGERKKKTWLGGFAMPHDPPSELVKRGYHLVSGAVDVAMFRKAAVDDVASFRKLVESGDHRGEEGRRKEGGDSGGYFSD